MTTRLRINDFEKSIINSREWRLLTPLWRNFLKGSNLDRTTEERLSDWNAKFASAFPIEEIEFETEKDLLMFVLKWS